jgi:hypothetical protein
MDDDLNNLFEKVGSMEKYAKFNIHFLFVTLEHATI